MVIIIKGEEKKKIVCTYLGEFNGTTIITTTYKSLLSMKLQLYSIPYSQTFITNKQVTTKSSLLAPLHGIRVHNRNLVRM